MEDKSAATHAVEDTWTETSTKMIEMSQQIMLEFLKRDNALKYDDWMNITEKFSEVYQLLLNKPQTLIDWQISTFNQYMELFKQTSLAWWGQDNTDVIVPQKKDRRFNHPDWMEHPTFNFIKQSYLLFSDQLQNLIGQIEELDEKTSQQISFYTRQWIDALAPSNFVGTNPEILQLTLDTQGKNLIKGLNHLLEDLQRSDGPFNIKMTDLNAFAVGKNLAVTPGQVVYQNEMMQLIQYSPSTEKVYKTPLLIIPPWINKYYILDLSSDNSFVKWAVSQGHTVFMISWVNPDTRYRHKSFSDYLAQGSLEALEVVKKITGEQKVNAIGFCVGGTLLGCTLSYLAHHQRNDIASATYLATLLDFSEPGDLGLFIDETQISQLEAQMQKTGYLDGRQLALTFNMLRDNDLIWSFFVNHYLAGREPFPFDILFWNMDSANLPERMHSFYLRNMYMRNLLIKPGGLALLDTPIDISAIKVPAYFLSTIDDHIAPWKTTYLGAKCHQGTVRFVLGGSGHIAGIINPPKRNKYGFWVNDALPDNSDQWFAKAKQQSGSWWIDWLKWIKERNRAQKVDARLPGSEAYKPIEKAPGRYVFNYSPPTVSTSTEDTCDTSAKCDAHETK